MPKPLSSCFDKKFRVGVKTRQIFKVGLVGFAHGHAHHILELLNESNLGTLVAAAIEDKPVLKSRKEIVQKESNLKRIYSDYQEMLDKEDIDVVFNYTDNVMRASVTELAASKGLHVMLEKPMAYNLEYADRMLKAAESNKVKLMVNWPTMWSPAYRKAYQLINEGAIGDVFHIRTRTGHDMPQKETFAQSVDFQWMGTKEGGGAYMDFCCYGAALTVWLMGMPKQVFGTAGNFVKSFLPGYDNGILVMMYDKGTATIEGTWSTIGGIPGGPMIFGSKGTILLGREITLFTKEHPEGKTVELDPLPEGERNAVEYFLTCVKEDKPIGGMCNPKLSRDVQEVLEAGIVSSENKKVVTLGT